MRARPRREGRGRAAAARALPALVLLDPDATLDGALDDHPEQLDRLRAAGVRLAVAAGAPALLLQLCAALGADPAASVLIGAKGVDVDAARAAGLPSFLLPSPETDTEEWFAAPRTAASLGEVVDRLLAGDW